MKNPLFDYDDSNLNSIIDYSDNLLNQKFSTILEIYETSPYKTYEDFQSKTLSDFINKKISMKSKGQYGNYIEKYFYGYLQNSDSNADFSKVGVELKVTPFKININCTMSAKERLVLTIINYMQENLDKMITRDEVASAVWLSPSYFSHLFKLTMGIGYNEYLTNLRIKQAKQMLLRNVSVSDIAVSVGFRDARYFSNIFQNKTGFTPSEYRRALLNGKITQED